MRALHAPCLGRAPAHNKLATSGSFMFPVRTPCFCQLLTRRVPNPVGVAVLPLGCWQPQSAAYPLLCTAIVQLLVACGGLPGRVFRCRAAARAWEAGCPTMSYVGRFCVTPHAAILPPASAAWRRRAGPVFLPGLKRYFLGTPQHMYHMRVLHMAQ
ncbi:hypothetical protein NDU88_000958 [Pleurodeles waltl]|uniref:Uncharacterized protein n=1 Tax=Pleurodeles waltl TaxID=8319 RepID=A0AAV7U8R8_PLEWA|nr:hypothetical protein NDU88_000958 [Pleurodeles waltl]